ncbi:Mog1p/PsbP-like protein [Vararia minispora EC-137]|uniref:Mog1p/PsbP-like protein n=1 Tax=Vararia minispora EC-137 TaxID=1314806 RepID=A0ACB8QE10_9AGAM|nr:Mog1p/PsbP-like protein [Vararia minispora EC-137]
MSSTRDLFGGAITASLPTALIDASELRQIPDTQEVFLSPTSDISIILEVLSSVPPSILADAAKFHFDSLAHDNDATSSTIQSVTTLPNDRGDSTPSPTVLVGTQKVAKFNAIAADDVYILLALYRVADKNVDLVLTMNVPTRGADATENERRLAEAKGVFSAAVRSLSVVDYSLFA